MTRQRFNRLRYTMCVQIREWAKKEGSEEVKASVRSKKGTKQLAFMGTPKGIKEGTKTYQECWDEMRSIIASVPVSKVER